MNGCLWISSDISNFMKNLCYHGTGDIYIFEKKLKVALPIFD